MCTISWQIKTLFHKLKVHRLTSDLIKCRSEIFENSILPKNIFNEVLIE